MADVMVSILCAAYNHEKYISAALDSFLMQETEYSYEVIVHDDASTDHTADIIREYERKYPDIIKPIYQTQNQYSQRISPTTFMLEKAKGKYLAVCEGDDFWVSPKKLQTQISFMEENPEYSLTVHAAYCAAEDGGCRNGSVFRNVQGNREVSTEEVLSKWLFATNSFVYRKAMRPTVIPYRQDCANGDFALVSYLALQGKVFNFDELFSAYRVNSVGSLNWQWRKNQHKYIEGRKKFADMLLRIDEYSNYRYHKVLAAHREEVLLQCCIISGDIARAKEHKALFEKMSAKDKLRLYVEHYIPGLIQLLKIMKNKCIVLLRRK